ncbi:MAG: 3,4-dihydroxy-2-butanone-4-phosphate synthase [Myxococcales bacterium]|nr:3,4-dihydroxy-2-butanone-4-phosphate synthase [Myxococcales bacterium]
MGLSGSYIDRVQKAITELRAGRMVILVDDEDRENEGDLVLCADLVTGESVNFMAMHARGLICLTMTEEMVQKLALPMMVDENRSQRTTAFTVSIEAREGVSTGISAQDRAHTIKVACAPDAKPQDLVSPGHVFPLRAKAGGVLQRTGHTEGSVDLARIAGRAPAAVICEIMNEDGTMARLPDLERFAEKHNLHILSIEDLIQWRLERERLVKKIESAPLRPAGFSREWTATVYETVEGRQFLSLTVGDLSGEQPVLVRMHPGAMFADLFAPPHGGGNREFIGGGTHLFEAMHRMESEGRGVVVYVPPPRIDLAHELRFLRGEGSKPPRDVGSDGQPRQREFGLGAQVLLDLGLRRIRLATNNPRKLVGLSAYGIEVIEQVQLGGETGRFGRGAL